MNFNISHPPPSQKALHDARSALEKRLHAVRMQMVALFLIGAFSLPLGTMAAMFLTGLEFSALPSQLIVMNTLVIIGACVYKLFKHMARAEDLEHRLDQLRPIVDDCCELPKLTAEHPLVQEYRSAVAGQKRHLVFGEYLVIKAWFESKYGKHAGHRHHDKQASAGTAG